MVFAAGAISPLVTMAQPAYPPIAPSAITASIDNSRPVVGATATLICNVVDAQGGPIEGATCAFAIASQPGTDASISPESALTDSQGRATAVLSVGSAPGAIIVRVTAGTVVSQVAVNAIAATEASPTPAEIPGLGGASTGASGGSAGHWLLLVPGAGVLLLAGYALLKVRFRRARLS